MAFKYNEIVPWGRNFDEYCRMFDLTASDLTKSILGCGDGPASFNSVCNAKGGNVVSLDPLYALSEDQISKRIQATFDNVISQTRENQERFRWNQIGTVENLGRIRMDAMRQFLDSYEQGKKDGRYVNAALPVIPFPDNYFDISLSSHFLFLYSDNLDYKFHYNAIVEMLRVSSQVRIFPLLDVNACKSKYVERMINDLHQYDFEIRKVNYEFQVGGNELMIISHQ